MKKLFGQQLREERRKQKLTVEVVAKACGTSRSYITLIENGRRLPSKKILLQIAKALHIKPATVLNWYLEDISQKLQKELKIT